MESNKQLPTSYLYVETKWRIFNDKTSLNDYMLPILIMIRYFDGWMGGWKDGLMNG
jgi:hypothetical protein